MICGQCASASLRRPGIHPCPIGEDAQEATTTSPRRSCADRAGRHLRGTPWCGRHTTSRSTTALRATASRRPATDGRCAHRRGRGRGGSTPPRVAALRDSPAAPVGLAIARSATDKRTIHRRPGRNQTPAWPPYRPAMYARSSPGRTGTRKAVACAAGRNCSIWSRVVPFRRMSAASSTRARDSRNGSHPPSR